MTMKTIDDLDVRGRRVLLRADLNVPLDGSRITDDGKIRACIPTLKALLDRGGAVVVCSHLARPAGAPDPAYSLAPGEVLMLENLRFNPGETSKDDAVRGVFGPISSIFDFLTFWVMLALLHAGHAEFRTGWFVESIATQTLVIYVIRTRRVPFFKSRPSLPMLLVPTGAALAGAILPYTGLAHLLGFTPLPTAFFLLLFGMVVVYVLLVELAKTPFYRGPRARAPQARTPRDRQPATLNA
jgi:hypothetical protein